MDLAFKNSDGKRDPVLTLAIVTTVVVLLKFLFSGFTMSVGGFTLNLGVVDGGIVGALLTPTLGAAVAHRYTDRKFDSDGDDTPQEPPKK